MVYLRGKTYWVRFKLNGVLYHKSAKTASRAEAEMYEQYLRGARAEPPANNRLRLAPAAERLYAEEGHRQAGGEQVRSQLLWLAAQYDNPLLNSIDTQFVEMVKRRLTTDGKAPATVNRYLAAIRRLLRTAKLQWGVALELPNVKLLREPPGRIRVVSTEEEQKLLQVLQGGFADLYLVLVGTGMRQGEALKMTWKHINWSEKLITLTPDITKSAKPRSIPMSPTVYRVLSRRHSQQLAKPFNCTKNQAEHAWRCAKHATGLLDEELCWHTLRHTFASRLLHVGVDLYTVSKLLGHSSVTTTERYGHLCTDRLRNAIVKLEEPSSTDCLSGASWLW